MDLKRQKCRTEYKSVTNGAQNTWLRFLYDGYLCVQVLYSNEPYNVFKEFVWDPTEPVATRPLVFRYAPNSLNLFYAFDGNKNVSDVFYRMTSNGIGVHYDYAPFGATIRTHSDSSASFDIVALNPFRFSSEYYDSELDLVYYNYRHYSPSLGRFLSRDPIEEQGGLNLYAFVGNNPLTLQDYLGRKIEGEPSYVIKEDSNLSEGVLGEIDSSRKFYMYISSWECGSHPNPLKRICFKKCYRVKSKLDPEGGVPPQLTLRLRNLKDSETKDHELVHFDFFKDNWIAARDILNSLEGVYCESWISEDDYGQKKAGDAKTYGKATVHFYEMKNTLQNVEYDWQSYGKYNNDYSMRDRRERLQNSLYKAKQDYEIAEKKFYER